MTNPNATLADRVGLKLDAARAGAKDYEQLLSEDLAALRRALAWRAFLVVAALILLTGATTLAGMSLLLSLSIEGLDWRTRPATWAVPLGFLLASGLAALLAMRAPRRPALAGTRQRLAEDAERLDQRARVAASEIEERLAPARRLWRDVSTRGVVGTAFGEVRGTLQDWWLRQPIQPALATAANEVRTAVDPLARRHPWWLLGGAAVAGAALVALMPRRWLRGFGVPLRTAVQPCLAALGPAWVAKTLAGFDLGSLLSAMFAPPPHGAPPAPHAPSAAARPGGQGAEASPAGR